MDFDCGRTGCTGGGTFALFVIVFWVIGLWHFLFSEPKSLTEYLKDLPNRIVAVAIFSAFCVAIGWVIIKIETFIFQ